MQRQVIIVAGGAGKRMGADIPKQFLPLTGIPVLIHTLNKFVDYAPRIILVLPEAEHETWQSLCEKHKVQVKHSIVSGGDTRFQSVKNGLAVCSGDGLIAIHDGVRPLVSRQVIENCFLTAEKQGAAIPAIPVIDSLRCIVNGAGTKVVDREDYRLVQTPQVFRAEWLHEAYRQAERPYFTDDASVVEAAGYGIALVEGNRENIKITTPYDLQIASLFCGSQK